MRFRDRRRAGSALGELVAGAEPSSPAVYALPRGGVPVGFEVAAALGCPLDVLIVRKVGVPWQPELAMGAISEGGVVVRNEGVIAAAGITDEVFDDVMRGELFELEARSALYRAVASPVDPAGRTAIVVDDGLATGSSARAAISVMRAREAAEIWLAVPVAPRDTVEALRREVDRVVIVEQPWHFGAVGLHPDHRRGGQGSAGVIAASVTRPSRGGPEPCHHWRSSAPSKATSG
jgi:predicted phosphoribosyltransferase